MAWKLYTDAACTTAFGGTLSFVHYSDFSDNPQDRVLYFGEVERDPADNGSYSLQRKDGNNVTLNLVDVTPGSGHEKTEFKLATTSAGLDTAVAGANLDLGTSLTSGASNSQPVHIRVTNTITTASVEVDVKLDIGETVAVAAGAA